MAALVVCHAVQVFEHLYQSVVVGRNVGYVVGTAGGNV